MYWQCWHGYRCLCWCSHISSHKKFNWVLQKCLEAVKLFAAFCYPQVFKWLQASEYVSKIDYEAKMAETFFQYEEKLSGKIKYLH